MRAPSDPAHPSIRKVRAAGAGGLTTTAAVGVAELVHLGVPAWLAALLTAAVAAVSGYLTRSAPGETGPPVLYEPDIRLPSD